MKNTASKKKTCLGFLLIVFLAYVVCYLLSQTVFHEVYLFEWTAAHYYLCLWVASVTFCFLEMYKAALTPTYFLKKVKEVFEKDDLTVVNLEGPLTTASNHLEKEFPFSGAPEYTKILTSSSVEADTLANNHSEDYYEAGLQDTKKYLDEASIGHFGYDDYYIKEIKGIKCGFLGYRSLSVSMNNESGHQKIQNAINHLKNEEQCQLVFVYYHWGIERQYQANEDQRSLAKFTIDAGADAVIGSHPHVVQGTETYNGKPIVYSLGNFCFGGNRNPSDTDTMIYQLSYSFKGTTQTGYQVQIIPCSLTSSRGRNDYQPYILKDEQASRVMEKIKKYSY